MAHDRYAGRLKLVLRGEVPEPDEVYVINGETIVFENSRKIVVPSKKNQQAIDIVPKTNLDTGEVTYVPVPHPSAQHQKWTKEHTPIFYAWKRRLFAQGVSLPIMRAKLKILFYFPDSKDRDLGNKAETIYDILRDTGIIIDDKFKCLKPITLDGWTQRDKPRTEIYLTILEPDSPEYGWDITDPTWHKKAADRLTLRQRVRRILNRLSSQNSR